MALTFPRGSLAFPFIGPNATLQPLVFLSPEDGHLLGAAGQMYGEDADVVDSGTFTTATNNVYAYDGVYTLLGNWDPPIVYTGHKNPRGNYRNRFYSTGAHQVAGTPAVAIQAISAVDASLVQTWELGHIIGAGGFAVGGLRNVAVGPADDVAYYGITIGDGGTAVQSRTVARYDLANSALLSALATDAQRLVSDTGYALLVLRNGEVLVGWDGNHLASTIVVHYAADGTVLHTYTLISGASHDSITLESALNDVTFWVGFYDDADYYRIQQIQIADGAVLADIEITTAQVTAINTEFDLEFNPDLGFFITRLGPTPHRAIRFMRIFPHVSDKNVTLFISRLEIEMQRGVGLITGQGSDPQVMLSISRDGGMTFGPEVWMTPGKIGEYLTRIYTTRLGRSRDWVFKLVVTDPVFLALAACAIDATEGTS